VRGGTYFSLQRQRKVGKRKPLKPLMPVPLHHAPIMVVAPERLSSRTTKVSDKAVIHPAARYARYGWVCQGNRMEWMLSWSVTRPTGLLVMPHGARSAAGGAGALSLSLKVRGDRRSGATGIYGKR
jgi:hypothetical protein